MIEDRDRIQDILDARKRIEDELRDLRSMPHPHAPIPWPHPLPYWQMPWPPPMPPHGPTWIA